MKTRALGSSGIEVGRIGLGGMPMSLEGQPPEAEAIEVIHAALAAGMNFIDTADVYCRDHTDIGHNERLIAKALSTWDGGEGVVVATKGGLERPGGAWRTNGHPEHLKWACEQSLAALGVEAITLYQLHAVDDRYPLADTVGALADLQRAGKILHVGLSNVSVAQIEEAQGIVRVVSVQNRCSVFHRQPWEDGVLSKCERDGIAFLPYSPVGGRHGHVRVPDHLLLQQIAARHDASPYEVALAWLLERSPVMIPIPGASKVTSAVSSARADGLELTDADMRELVGAFPV